MKTSCTKWFTFTAVLFIAVATLALGFAAPASAQCSVQQTLPTTAEDFAKCQLGNPGQWHFVITSVPRTTACPAVTVAFTGCGVTSATSLAKTGGVCHYEVTDAACINATLDSATYGGACLASPSNFNVSHAPCTINTEVLAVVGQCNPATNNQGDGLDTTNTTNPPSGSSPAGKALPPVANGACPVAANEDGPADLTAVIGQEHITVGYLTNVGPVPVQDKAYVPGGGGSGWMKFYRYVKDADCLLHNKTNVVNTEIVPISGSSTLSSVFTITSANHSPEFGYVACLVDSSNLLTAQDVVCGECEHWPTDGDGDEWCSPGYWRNAGDKAWTDSRHTKNELYLTYFAASTLKGTSANNNPTLYDVLLSPQTYGGEAFNNVGDLLSAGHPAINFTIGDERVENCPINNHGCLEAEGNSCLQQ